MNRKGETFDRDNGVLAELKSVKEQPKLLHPDIIAEVPGAETEDMYNSIIWPNPIGNKIQSPLYSERALRLRRNTGLDTDNQASRSG